MKIKVLMLVRDASWYGGVVNFINLLTENLSSNVDLTNLKIGQRKESDGKLSRLFQPLFDAYKLLRILGKNTYNIIHINPSLNSRSLLRDGLFLLVIRVASDGAVVVFLHGWDEQCAKKLDNSYIYRKLFIGLFGHASLIYVLANSFRDRLAEWGIHNNKIKVTTTMFDGRHLSKSRKKHDTQPVQLLFLSRFVKEKGVFELLGAFNQLHEEYPELKLVFAGEGPEQAGMEAFIRDHSLGDYVRFSGYVRDEQKVHVLEDADIFVFPSYYGEGCPVSLLEAMASGLPVVTTTVGGIGNIVQAGINGVLLKDVTVKAIRQALNTLLKNETGRIKMGEFNREQAWEKYEAGVLSAQIEKDYRRLAGSR